MVRRVPAWVAAAAVLAVLAGCSSDRKPVYPVSGQVLFNDRPLKKVVVSFHPVDAANFPRERPNADTDEDGRFKLHTYLTGDGAPEGEYRVTVAWFLSSGRPGDDSPPANYLPERYARTDTTPLRAVVRKGGVELQPFDLQSR